MLIRLAWSLAFSAYFLPLELSCLGLIFLANLFGTACFQVKIALNNLGNTLCVTSRWVTVGSSFLEAYRFFPQVECSLSSFGTLSFLRME